MLKIIINNCKYKIPVSWEDITLSQCAWLYSRTNELSEGMLNYYKSFASDVEPVIPDITELATFSLDAIAYLASIPKDVFVETNKDDITKLSMSILPRFVCGILGHVDYRICGMPHFTHKYRRYYFPKSGSDVMGDIMPLSKISAIEFCQLSDIVMSDNISLASLAISIVCRRKNEQYDDETVQYRANLFKSLPASIYWELWAKVSAMHKYFKDMYPDCYGKSNDNNSDEQDGATSCWCDTLVSLSADKPSELEHLQRMNCYDFMHLLSAHIKRRNEEWKMRSMLASLGAR